MSEPLHYIMHIPKTAGMSLQEDVIKLNFKYPDEIELIYDQEKNQQGFINRPDLKVVMGHFRFGFQKHSDRAAHLYTFLRNPLEHVISHYYYTLDKPQKFEFLPEGINDVVDFANGPYGYNLQTRFISGINNIKGKEEIALLTALDNLKTFRLVGLTEEFDTSLIMLKELMDLKRIFYQKRNAGIARKERSVTHVDKEELKRILKWDMELYKIARQLHFNQRKNFSQLNLRTKVFQRFNPVFWKLNPTYTKLKLALGLASQK